MELRDILRKRRMHRAFLPEPIPREQIERIAGVIRRAPSGGFSQGASIVVITDNEVKRELIDRFEMSGTYADDAPVVMVISAKGRRVPIGLAFIGKPGEAPEIGSRLKSRQRSADELVHWQRW
jgi:nitroreductase